MAGDNGSAGVPATAAEPSAHHGSRSDWTPLVTIWNRVDPMPKELALAESKEEALVGEALAWSMA
jgi:hypothetical protein